MNLEDKTIRIVPYRRAQAAWNLALEEALYIKSLEKLKDEGTFIPIVRLYSFSSPSVILGNRQRISEIDYTYCIKNNVEVTMRKTGGGSVYLGRNDIQYTFILPVRYSRDILFSINSQLVNGLTRAGYTPVLTEENNHPVIRLQQKSFVFDAQKRSIIYNGDIENPKFAILHHGTILIDNRDYDHMPSALKADKKTLEKIQKGNVWLARYRFITEQLIVDALQRSLPFAISQSFVQDYTAEEIILAKELYQDFYANPEKFSDGKKRYGICYIPTLMDKSTEYDMEKYVEQEVSAYHGSA